MDNLEIYNALRTPPETAKKQIRGGRLKGMTDINPMWRIKALTEQFGPCGVGWVYSITDKRLEPGANGEVSAFVDIELSVKIGDNWSHPIPGTGGAAFISKEQGGAHTSDECFKMALTDALSVACKALGVAADVYWEKDRTKYDQGTGDTQKPSGIRCEVCGAEITGFDDGRDIIPAAALAKRSKEKYGKVLCVRCGKAAQRAGEGA